MKRGKLPIILFLLAFMMAIVGYPLAVTSAAPLTVIKPDFKIPLDYAHLIITPATETINTGDTANYQALWHSPGAADQNVTSVCDWTIDNASIATVGADGTFIGKTAGNSKVHATYTAGASSIAANKTAAADIIVKQKPQSSLSLKVLPVTNTVYVGDLTQFKAYLHNSNGSADVDVTPQCVWGIVDPYAQATANKGEYLGLAPGLTDVTAHYHYQNNLAVAAFPAIDLTGEARLTVKAKPDIPPPPTERLPEGKMIDRQPNYITLSTPQNLGTPANEFTMSYDASKMDGNSNRHPKVFYWNTAYQKWVALATYPNGAGSVKAQNDGHYSGWFVVMGCIQPTFTDIPGTWAENYINRMNGLGLIEGYPDPNNPTSLIRPAGPDRVIIRCELTTMVARILGLAPGDTHLYPTITFMTDPENIAILNAHYADADNIPGWSRPFVAAMTKAGLVSGQGYGFAPNNEMTRIEAAVMISNALKNVPGFNTPADLSVFTDYDQVPSWAIGKVAQGTIGGYPDGTLRPNQPITRAEAQVLLLTLLKGLGW